jgi:hypothetical protein
MILRALPPVIDVSALQLLLVTVAAWLDRRKREMLAYLVEENRLLRRQLGGWRLRLTDADRRRLAARAHPWAVTRCARSRRSSRRTRCFAGIDN